MIMDPRTPIGNPKKRLKDYRRFRRQFYERVAALVKMPTRITATRGVAWMSEMPGVYHHLKVGAYAGSFDELPYREYCRPVPRIYLDCLYWHLSKAQARRWSGGDRNITWSASKGKLELTVALDELADFAAWVACWARAYDTQDADAIPWPPHPLEGETRSLAFESYLWTPRATADYRLHCRHNRRMA